MLPELITAILTSTAVLIIVLSFAVLPFINRKTISFGISIPGGRYNDPEVANVRKKYLYSVILSGIVFIASAIILLLISPIDTSGAPVFAGIMIFIVLAANTLIYLISHKKIKRLKTRYSWGDEMSSLVTINTDFHHYKNFPSPMWFVVNILIITATIVSGLILYDSIPGELLAGYNLLERIHGLLLESPAAILCIPAVQFLIVSTFAFIYFSIIKAKQQLDPANPEMSYRQNIKSRYYWMIYIISSSILLQSVMALAQLMVLGIIKSNILFIASAATSVVIAFGAVIVGVTSRHRGSNIRNEQRPQKEPVSVDDDRYWKLGIFYFNPQDPSVFIEKRLGIGWTVNWGRLLAWIILVALIAVIVVFMISKFYL